jgi:hypothetical protein
MDRIEVYHDESGRYFDEYTVVIGNSVFGMSKNALSPQGFNQYCSEKRECNFAKEKKIQLRDLPDEVKEAIKRRI